MNCSNGQIAYECFARLSGIGPQRHKNNLARDQLGAMPWEKVPAHIRARWEIFAKDFVDALRVEATMVLHEELRKKGATLEDERRKISPMKKEEL